MGAGLTACGSDDDDDSPAKPTTPGKPTPEQPKPVDLNFGRAREHGRHRRGARGLPVRRAQPLGRSVFAGAPAFKADASNGGADQARQIGYNHDGMHFFPIDGTDSATGSSVEGLMVTNHEYTTPEYFYPVGVVPGNAQWNLDWVRKSQHAHGVSVLHIRLNNGKWGAGAGFAVQPQRQRQCRHATGRPGRRQPPGQDQRGPVRHALLRHLRQLRQRLHAVEHLPHL